MEINGKTCYFYNTWVTDDIPSECKECDCNCRNDCPDCQICGTDGTCQPDPACEPDYYEIQVWQYVLTITQDNCGSFPTGTNDWVTYTTTTSPESNLEYRFNTFSGSDNNGTIPTFDICGGSCPGEYVYARLFNKDTDTEIPNLGGFVSGCRRSSVNNNFRYEDGRYEVRVVPVYN
jgi:hypothetical protein